MYAAHYTLNLMCSINVQWGKGSSIKLVLELKLSHEIEHKTFNYYLLIIIIVYSNVTNNCRS